MGLIRLAGVDGQEIGLFEYDEEAIRDSDAVDVVEWAFDTCRETADPHNGASTLLEERGITRVCALDAYTDVL